MELIGENKFIFDGEKYIIGVSNRGLERYYHLTIKTDYPLCDKYSEKYGLDALGLDILGFTKIGSMCSLRRVIDNQNKNCKILWDETYDMEILVPELRNKIDLIVNKLIQYKVFA